MKTIFSVFGFLLIVLLFATLKSSNAKVSCPTCQTILYDNITSDIAQHMYSCEMQESDQCYGGLFVSYTNKKQTIDPVYLGSSENLLDINDPEDFVHESLLISLKNFYISRGIRVHCSESSNCSLHQLQLFSRKGESS